MKKTGNLLILILMVFVPLLLITCGDGAGDVVFVAVTNISGLPSTGTVAVPITLNGIVEPAEATNKSIAWSIVDDGYTGAILGGPDMNVLTTAAAGTPTIRATIANGTVSGDYTQDFSVTFSNNFIPVTDITNLPVAEVLGKTYWFSSSSGTIVPSDASAGIYNTTWSIVDPGTTGATMTFSGTLSNTAIGTVRMRATIANGSAIGTPFTKDFDFKIVSPLTEWKQVSSKPFTEAINCIEYYPNGKIFIAGSVDGRIATSPDGNSWTIRTSPFPSKGDTISDIKIADTMVFAVGGYTIAWSDNGTTWTSISVPFSFPNIMAFYYDSAGKYYYVAGYGASNNIAYSTSGTSGWTQIDITVITESINAIGKNNYLAVGNNGFNAVALKGYWVTYPTLLGGSHIYCVGGIGAYPSQQDDVVGGAGGKIAFRPYTTSTWTNIPAGAVNNTTSTFSSGTSINALEEGSKGYYRYLLAGGTNGGLAISPNGKNWSAIPSADAKIYGTTVICDIAFGNNTFVAVGSDGTIVYTTLAD